jgi:hypothetical protein|tara:strand:+ start:12335 stop:12694 length:360 start_codon:yes stop_codon:yes gene_type:complete
MIVYEYKGIDLSLLGGLESVVNAFNEQGSIGWELVSVLGGIGYFKRASNNGFGVSDEVDSESESNSMTIITTQQPSGEEVPLNDSVPPKRRVGRPPKANPHIGVILAEDTLMPSPESLS